MIISLDQIRSLDLTRWPTPTKLIYDQPPPTPLNLTVTAATDIIRVQWAAVTGVDGYDIAVMTSPNLAAPDVSIVSLNGANQREWVYNTGNVAITRYFAIRSVVSGVASNWSTPVSATSNTIPAVSSGANAQQVSTTSASETVLKTITIAANTLGVNDGVAIWAAVQAAPVGTSTFKIRWGGLTGTVLSTLSPSTSTIVNFWGQLFNRNATNSQFCLMLGVAGANVSETSSTAARDTTASQDIVVTGSNDSASAAICEALSTFIVRGSAGSTDTAPPTPPSSAPSGTSEESAGRDNR